MPLLPAIMVAVTTLIGFGIGIFSLMSGWTTIFQNLLYIPIIIACVYYTRRGFICSVAIAGGYFVLMALFSQDSAILEGAVIRVLIFIIIAAVITYLSEVRMRTEATMRESEEKYRSLFENAVEGFFKTTADGHFVSANPFLAKLLGFNSPRELIEKLTNIGEQHYADPKDRETFKNILESHGSISQYETRLLKKDGTVIWASINARAVRDDKGSILYYEGTLEDITERKQAAEALRVSEEWYRAIYDTSPLAIIVWDCECRIVNWNRQAEKVFGWVSEEILGKNFFEYIIPESARPVVAEIVDLLLAGRLPSRSVNENLTKRGETILCEWNNSIQRDRQGQIIGVISLALDITDRKRAEEEKDTLQAQLIQAQKMESVGRLAGGVAHDFNNMLNVILGYAQLAMMDLPETEPVYEYLKGIKDSAVRSADLIRKLLAFARKQTIAPIVLELNDTIKGMLAMIRRLIGENINFAWIPGENLWQVKIDPAQIDQLLANLLVNARDSIADVGKITIETENTVLDEAYCSVHKGFRPGKYVMLAVSDDGHGMGKDVLDHLFEPFFTTKKIGKGTGLGLSTVYGIVKQNEGFINVYSESGKGSTFKIYLPKIEGEATKLKDVSQAEMPKGNGETILLVEDEASLLNIVRMMLEQLNYKVLTAGTPGEALRQVKDYAAEIELIITDVIMPEMNGRDLAKLISDTKPGLKCLFVSGYTANVIAHHGILEEGVNFIQKPFSMQTLASKVREVLERE